MILSEYMASKKHLKHQALLVPLSLGFVRHVSIPRSGANIAMSQHFLDDPYIRAILYHDRGWGMSPKYVDPTSLRNARQILVVIEHPGEVAPILSSSIIREEQRLFAVDF